MQKKFLVKVFDGRKEKFVADVDGKKITTPTVDNAAKFNTDEEAEAAIAGIELTDEMAEILGSDFIHGQVCFSIVPVFIHN